MNALDTSKRIIQHVFSGICLLMLFVFEPSHLFAELQTDSLQERRISLEEYQSRMKAGWIGQMAGVGWGAPTEFAYNGRIIPSDKVPKWNTDMVNVFSQDDLYVEMTFLQTMLDYGIDVDIKQAGIDFANSAYLLWVANRVGRENLRKGIAPPNSGHPMYNPNADAIDYQIEADYSGLIAPGLPNEAVKLGETFGRLMNYGDGLYGGQFVGAMYAEAFFESDPIKIVEKGLQYIPTGSQYAEAIRDVLSWYSENPDDWEKTWGLINEKYHLNPAYRKFTSNLGAEQNIDAKLNGAYVVMGLLYGKGDPDQTIIISMRCGQDSDCNPSNAAGILFTSLGLEAIPERYTSALNEEEKFSFTEFTFPDVLKVSETLAIEIISRAGGQLEKDSSGKEILLLPVEAPKPGKLEQSWNPGDPAAVTFAQAELAQIEGSKLFNWSLVFLVLLVLLAFHQNRNSQAFSILIPFGAVYGLLELAKGIIPPDLLATANIVVMLQSVCAAIAILLLVFAKEAPGTWAKIGISMLLLALIGGIAAFGASDGRIIAATKITLIGSYMLSFEWFLAILISGILVKKQYKRLTFNLIYFASLFLVQIAGVYVFSLAMSQIAGPWTDFIGNWQFILFGAVLFSTILYLLSIPYLVLVRYQKEFQDRFSNILGLQM